MVNKREFDKVINYFKTHGYTVRETPDLNELRITKTIKTDDKDINLVIFGYLECSVSVNKKFYKSKVEKKLREFFK